MSGDSKVVKAAGRRPPNAGKGRVKGVRNKSTLAVKEALTAAFEGLGGVKTLQDWAHENQTEFYKLWAKMLPTEVKADVGGGITITLSQTAAKL